MTIYNIITEKGIYTTASKRCVDNWLAKQCTSDAYPNVKRIIAWNVKTQGKNFNTYAKGNYYYGKPE